MATYVHDVELKLAMSDPRSSLNIMALPKLEATGCPQRRIIEHRWKSHALEAVVLHSLLDQS